MAYSFEDFEFTGRC